MSPLVSVLIPCFNAEPWLAQTVQSVINQTWKKVEIIIVDDGSTDQSLAIAQSFQAPNLTVVKQEHQGIAVARNQALKLAQGEFIQFLDPQDLLSPNKIAAQLLLLQFQPSNTLALCNTVNFWDGDSPDHGTLTVNGFCSSYRSLDWLIRFFNEPLQDGNLGHPSAWLFPRPLIESVGYWDETFTENDHGEYLTRVIAASSGVQHSSLCHSYRRHFQVAPPRDDDDGLEQAWLALRALDMKANYLLRQHNSEVIKRAISRSYTEQAIKAYPYYPAITDTALQRIKTLNMKPQVLEHDSWQGEVLRILLGWRTAKLMSLGYQ